MLIYFVRHGEAESATEENRDPALTGLGEIQAQKVSARLADIHFDKIYCSDLRRAHDTARAIQIHQPHMELTVLPELREVSPYQLMDTPPPDDDDTRRRIGEENKRVQRCVQILKSENPKGDAILVVCHGNIIRTLIPRLAHKDPRDAIFLSLANTSVSIVKINVNGVCLLKTGNSVRHLHTDEITD